ncbi:MAG: hypothetical protein ACRDA4_04740 [Filifactoraceae bacterium]
MYQMLGMDIVDSNELSEQIKSKTKVNIKEDITKGTQREDAIGYKASINIIELGYKKGTEFNDEKSMDELLNIADEYVKVKIREILPRVMDFTVFSNTYDPVAEEVNLILVIMHISNADRKLRDVLKRLLRI